MGSRDREVPSTRLGMYVTPACHFPWAFWHGERMSCSSGGGHCSGVCSKADKCSCLEAGAGAETPGAAAAWPQHEEVSGGGYQAQDTSPSPA